MTTLGELASAMKSANAGASWLTVDIVFRDDQTFSRVECSGALGAETVAERYGLHPSQVKMFFCPEWRTVKLTVPRPRLTGGVDETDFDGTQQFVPLLSLEVDEAVYTARAGVGTPGRADGTVDEVEKRERAR
jgi:hypothetical protein